MLYYKRGFAGLQGRALSLYLYMDLSIRFERTGSNVNLKVSFSKPDNEYTHVKL